MLSIGNSRSDPAMSCRGPFAVTVEVAVTLVGFLVTVLGTTVMVISDEGR